VHSQLCVVNLCDSHMRSPIGAEAAASSSPERTRSTGRAPADTEDSDSRSSVNRRRTRLDGQPSRSAEEAPLHNIFRRDRDDGPHRGTVERPTDGRAERASAGASSSKVLPPELAEGVSVDRLARGECSLNDTISILRDVARSLDAAHTKGVIHRDIK